MSSAAVNGHPPSAEGDSSDFFGYFAPGPSKLPDEVMRKAQKEFMAYKNTRVNVMELSHRSPEYMAINDEAVACVRRLFSVPNNYKIFFMSGGGTGQFAAVPLNLLPEGQSADYCVTGTWSEKALKEAKLYGNVNNVHPLSKYTMVPEESTWSRNKDASYIYYCDNETIHGVEFPFIPSNEGEFSNVPVVADMSSNMGTRVFDINRFGVVYATVQKNLGPAGCTIVIAREDLIGKHRKYCPTVLNYEQISKANSLLNTPVTYSVYMTKLVLEWVEENGGLSQMEKNSQIKSKLMYDVIDNSNGFYCSNIAKECRSRCNVVFRLKDGDESLESAFIASAKKNNLLAIKGHRSVGGIRVSIYNAISMPMVEKLVEFMKEFQAEQHE